MSGEPLMTVAEAAGHYFKGMSPRHIRNLARAGAFGPKLTRLGRDWLIPERGIQKFIEAHTVTLEKGKSRIADPTVTPERLRNLVPFRQ